MTGRLTIMDHYLLSRPITISEVCPQNVANSRRLVLCHFFVRLFFPLIYKMKGGDEGGGGGVDGDAGVLGCV